MIQSFMQNKRVAYALMGLFAIVIMAFFLWNARWGIGVEYDSLFYLNSAQNLLSGNGLQWLGTGNSLKPLTHFPPLYPLLIALWNFFIPDLLKASTWLGSLLFGVNIMLVGSFVFTYTRNSLYALAAMLVVFISPDLVDVQLWAMSEALFFIWMMLSLGLLILYVQNDRMNFLVGSAIAAALACLTRYIGLTIVATGLLTILYYKPGLRVKLRNAFVYGLISVLPLGIWYLRNLFLTGSMTNRSFVFHQILNSTLNKGYHTVLGWFIPIDWAYHWKIIFLVAIGFFIFLWMGWFLWKKIWVRTQDATLQLAQRYVFVLSLFAVVYVAFLFVSLTFIDASTRLEERILSPLHLDLFLLLFAPMISMPRHQLLLGAALFVLVLVSFVPTTRVEWGEFRRYGLGMSGKTWQTSPSVDYVRRLGSSTLLYSNEALALQYLTGNPVLSIPQKFDRVKREQLPQFEKNLAIMRNDLETDGAYLVLFKARKGVEYPSVEILSEGLTLVKDLDDGLVYQYQP